jgi:ubiquinone/menaquinone biosynthesis C-methylase UbiE
MLSRTLEPEVMDTLAEAVDYDTMDHSAVNQSFSEEFLAALKDIPDLGSRLADPAKSTPLTVLDVGTGTARIPIAICRLTERLRITAVDLSAHMLQLGQRNVIENGFERQIRLEHVDAKGLPYPDASFDAVISNSIVHHIPQPIRVVREMLRVLRPGGLLFVRDLLRPPDAEEIATILSKHAAGTNDHQRQLFEQSLHAALTLDEVAAMLRELSLSPATVTQTSDRHWTIVTRK